MARKSSKRKFLTRHWKGAYATARQMLNVSSNLFSTSPVVKGGQTEDPEALGELVTAAINLFFALELFMKCLIVMSGRRPSDTHDL